MPRITLLYTIVVLSTLIHLLLQFIIVLSIANLLGHIKTDEQKYYEYIG